mgnify:FL=1
MEETNFWYWLQGGFELSRSSVPLTVDQFDCINKHALLVGATHLNPKRSAKLTQLMTVAELGRQNLMPAENATVVIKTLAAEQFQHVIDPQAGPPEVQAKLNNIHGPPMGGHRPDGVTLRC